MNRLTQSAPILAFPFRPFFLLTGLYAVAVVVAWMSYLFGGTPLPLGWSPLHWHSHEMLFGLTSAAIAGFILTAICNWTGAAPLHGSGLLALVLLWLAGRVTMWTASWLPVGVVAVVDMLFLPWVAIYVLRVLLRHGNKRNLVLVAILALLSLANLMMHIGFVAGQTLWLKLGELMAFNLITLMIIVIGGRIIPAFTGNWLRSQGGPVEAVKSSDGLERTTLIVTALLIPADFLTASPALAGGIALLAAAVNALRLWRWSGWLTVQEPLLWILHIGYAWIVLALLFKGLAAFELIAPSVWQHALGLGGMTTLILGVMTRVAMGHTGRTLALPRFGIVIYLAITLAAISRVLTAFEWLNHNAGLILAASGWVLAFCLFTLIYWPVLTRPRIDGRPG
jgi:uncharacterized protein involved in response to NO